MNIKIKINKEIEKNDNIAYIGDIKDFKAFKLTSDQKKFIKSEFENNKSIVEI